MGARFRRLLRATPLACTRSRSGSVAPPGSELALDRDIHPALDRLSDREREVSPTAEAHRDLIGEVPGVPAIEEVADGLIAATRALRDPRFSKRPRLIGLGVLLNSAEEAPARNRCRLPRSASSVSPLGDRMHALPG